MAATDALCRSFLDLWWHFDPGGRTAGRLGDFGSEAVRQHAAALRAIAVAVEELDVEDTADEIDRTALLDHIRVLLFRFEHEHPYRTNPLLWTEHLLRSFAPAPDQDQTLASAAALERLRALPQFCRRAQDTIRKPPPLLALGAREQLDAIAQLLNQARSRFGPAWAEAGEDPVELLAEGRSALGELEAAFLDRLAPDDEPHAGAIGPDEADRRLHYEHASIHNAGEVWRNALRLAAEVEQEVTALAAAVDPGLSWPLVYRAVAGESLDAAGLPDFLTCCQEAVEFTIARDLAPGQVPAVPVQLLHDRSVLNAWAELVSPDSGDPLLRIGEVPAAALPWLAARLCAPGALLRESASQTLPGLVRRRIRASSTAFGWELHAQELMAELGFRTEPGDRLVERVLFLRDVHLALVDIGLHTRQLTAAEAVAHLSTRIPFENTVALADVRRMLTFPLSACAALLGRQELRRLREDHAAARGSADLGSFHRELFEYGGLPIPLIRWGMQLDG